MWSRFPALALSCFCLALPVSVAAQDAGPIHAPDGRGMQLIAPLRISSKPNAPFTAISKTLVVRTLADGSTVTNRNERRVARDADGRVFQERVTFVPVPDDGRKMRVHAIDYDDPVEHTRYHCDTESKVCNLFAFDVPVTAGVVPAGLQPDKTTYLEREDLGADTFSGVEVQHSRETTTLASQSVGNSRTILRTVEYWYSSALDVNVQVKRHDLRDGDQTLWLTDVSLSTPDPETFRVPADYRIIDHRNPESSNPAPPADPQ
jgi:hypothetical protein